MSIISENCNNSLVGADNSRIEALEQGIELIGREFDILNRETEKKIKAQKPVRMDARRIRATIDDIEYVWEGGFGAILSSIEEGVKLKETRMIGNQLFYAYLSYPTKWWSKKRRICWSIPDCSIEKIREIRNAIFGTY